MRLQWTQIWTQKVFKTGRRGADHTDRLESPKHLDIWHKEDSLNILVGNLENTVPLFRLGVRR
jgi:hypothetical protein